MIQRNPSNWKRFKPGIFNSSVIKLNTIYVIVALMFIGGFFILNWAFMRSLRTQYKEVTEKEARLYTAAISSNLHITELNWAFAEILRKSKFPIIITDKYYTPVNWKNIRTTFFSGVEENLNSQQNFHKLNAETQSFLRRKTKSLAKVHEPIELLNKGNIFGYFHYGDEKIINLLSWLPLLEFLVLLLFFVVVYNGYHIIRSEERTAIWVALAKETAHQMGTPLSSLMGWMEYLRLKIINLPNTAKIEETLNEMHSDISRLTKVSIRFSQIGSTPKLKQNDLNLLIRSTINYFNHRLPQIGKKVDLIEELKPVPKIWMNNELIGWVLENLIKNSLDSIHNKNGIINIKTSYQDTDETVHIKISDNGRGIEKENWKKVFQTGFSTKKRGWGLGLSLARRIITIYHEGDIYVENSAYNQGTQLRIVLPVFPAAAKKDLDG